MKYLEVLILILAALVATPFLIAWIAFWWVVYLVDAMTHQPKWPRGS